jgi:predicted DNA-binding protein
MGRPTDNPKKNNTRIRMTDEEVRMLNYCCEQTGQTKTAIISMGIKKVYDELKK